jgi:hypothetical protein
MDQRRGQVFVSQWGPLRMSDAQVRVAVAVPHSVLEAIAAARAFAAVSDAALPNR